jgi:type IV pilus assembly protein PilQ
LAGEADPDSGARPTNRRIATTRVLVRNAQTAVIGGIYQNDTQNSETRVPYLSKIPVIGWLFKGSTSSDQKNELLIFLTPRILGQLDSNTIPSQNSTVPATSAAPSEEFNF